MYHLRESPVIADTLNYVFPSTRPQHYTIPSYIHKLSFILHRFILDIYLQAPYIPNFVY